MKSGCQILVSDWLSIIINSQLATPFYPNIENLVLWVRSEKIGFAVTLPIGIMEYWSVGIMGLAE